MNSKSVSYVYASGAAMLFIASLGSMQHVVFNYVFAVASFILIFYHAFVAYNDQNIKTQRVHRIAFVASLFLAIASYFRFTDSYSWVVMVLIYAAITIYLSFRGKE